MSCDAKYIFCYSNENDAWDDRHLIGELYDEFDNCNIVDEYTQKGLYITLTWDKAKHTWYYNDVLSQFKASLIFVKYDDEAEFVDLYDEDVFKKLLNDEHPLIKYREVILEQSHIGILHGIEYLEEKLRKLKLIQPEPFFVDKINYSYEFDLKHAQIEIINNYIQQLLARLPLCRRPWEYLNAQERFILRGASNIMQAQNNNDLKLNKE